MVTASLGYGGAEKSFLRVAQFLSEHGHVSIALMARNYGGGGYSVDDAATDLHVNMLSEGWNVAGTPLSKLRRWAQMRERLKELKEQHDVAISFLPGPNLLNALSGFQERTIISERGSRRFDFSGSTLWRALWLRGLDPIAYRRSRYIVAASEGLAGEITSRHPELAARVVAIEGTVNTRSLIEASESVVPQKFENFSKYKTVIGIGRMHPQKGFDVLLRIFARVRARMADARLLLVGDGPEFDVYQRLSLDLGLRTGKGPDPTHYDVVFAGYRPDPFRYLPLARVFAFPSHYEGLPNALIEGVASGIPILASDCPWGPRSILAGSNDGPLPDRISSAVMLTHGILMPMPNTPEAIGTWETALYVALQREPQRRPLEDRRAAVARFDIEATGPQWFQLVEEIVRRIDRGTKAATF